MSLNWVGKVILILSWNPGWWKGLRDEDKTENAAIGDRRGMAVVGCDELPETVEEPLEGRKNRQRESEVKGNCFGAEGV